MYNNNLYLNVPIERATQRLYFLFFVVIFTRGKSNCRKNGLNVMRKLGKKRMKN